MNIFRFDNCKTVAQKNIGKTVSRVSIALLSGLSLSSLTTSALVTSSLVTSALVFGRPTPAAAQFAQLPPTLEFVPPPLPERGRPRGRSSGTASRGSCELTGQLPLTALVPVTQVSPETGVNITYDSIFSLTAQANPTFWFYVPYQLSDTPLEFVLQDEQNQTLYQSIYQPSSEDIEQGVVKVKIPDGEVTLAEGDRYHWFFMAYCDENAPSFVEGWIERTADVATSDREISPREKARIHASNGIWQDAITQIGEQVLAGEGEASADWEALLSSVGLEAIAQQPLVDCCEATPAIRPLN